MALLPAAVLPVLHQHGVYPAALDACVLRPAGLYLYSPLFLHGYTIAEQAAMARGLLAALSTCLPSELKACIMDCSARSRVKPKQSRARPGRLFGTG